MNDSFMQCASDQAACTNSRATVLYGPTFKHTVVKSMQATAYCSINSHTTHESQSHVQVTLSLSNTAAYNPTTTAVSIAYSQRVQTYYMKSGMHNVTV